MAEAPLILGILGSTRQGRRGGKVAAGSAGSRRAEDIGYEPVDLRDWDLGFFDEPARRSTGEYAARSSAAGARRSALPTASSGSAPSTTTATRRR